MNSGTELNREVEEHIKLLRKAARGELLLLSLGVLATLGLWVTLQAGDQKTPAIDELYKSTLVDLKKRWGVSVEIPIDYASSILDVAQALKSEKTDLNKDSVKQRQFYTELQDLAAKYSADREGAYRVQLRIPYLQDPVVINGLLLADVWPFGVALILATELFCI